MVRRSDTVVGKVSALRTIEQGVRVATLRFCHRDYRADRWWSWCDVDVRVPADAGPIALADEVEVVLASVADASRVADGPGHYSCRLHPASEAPVLPPERAVDGVYGGLVERSEPPAGGEMVLHLGSGLTCRVRVEGEGPFPVESLVHGEWSEFILLEPHEVAWFSRVVR